MTTEPIPFRLHLLLAIHQAKASGHMSFAAALAVLLREEIEREQNSLASPIP